MGALCFALFVVLAVRMALVIVVAIFPALAMVLTITVPLGLGVAAVAMAISLYGRGFGLAAALQDVGSHPAPQCEDDGNSDHVLFADGGFAGVHSHSQFCGAVKRESWGPPSRRSTSAAAR